MHHRIEKIRCGFKTAKYQELNHEDLNVYHSFGGLPLAVLQTPDKPSVASLRSRTYHLLNFSIPRGFELMRCIEYRDERGKLEDVKIERRRRSSNQRFLWNHELPELQGTSALLLTLIGEAKPNDDRLPEHPRRLAIPHNCEEENAHLTNAYSIWPPHWPLPRGPILFPDLVGKFGPCSSLLAQRSVAVHWLYKEVFSKEVASYITESLVGIGYEGSVPDSERGVHLLPTVLPNNNLAWIPLEVDANGSISPYDQTAYFPQDRDNAVFNLRLFTYLDGPDIFIGRLPPPPPPPPEDD